MTKILVIEDEAPIRENLLRFLKFEGYQVTAAENGAAGLDAIRTEPPDLILCDVMMPKMTGFELMAELKKEPLLSAIPFIFLTASAEKDSIEKGIAMGAMDYVTKPFNLVELATLIRRLLGENI
jgi:CheY-like chemotaxis protein